MRYRWSVGLHFIQPNLRGLGYGAQDLAKAVEAGELIEVSDHGKT